MLGRLAPTLLHHSGRRSYAASTAAAAGGKTSLPLIAGLAALGAGGAYYAFGGVSPKDAKHLEDKAKRAVGMEGTGIAEPPAPGALSPSEFRTFKLIEKRDYNHDTALFSFELPAGKESGLTVASALVTRSVATEGDAALLKDGKPVVRPYTPVTAPGAKGRLDLLVKKYPDGAMTGHIHNLKPGDALAMKGPIPKFPWKPNQFEVVGMIAGGSGITPHWQIIQEIASNPEDKTKVIMLFANKEERDILLREELEALQKKYPAQFSFKFGLEKSSPNWSGLRGYLSADVLAAELPPKELGDKVKIFVCGPPGQVKAVAGPKKGMQQGELGGALKELGYTEDQVFKF